MGKTFHKYKGKEYPDKDSKNRKCDRSCLNHGGCPYCERNRLYSSLKGLITDKDDYEYRSDD